MFPKKLLLKETANIKLLVDEEGQFLAAGNTLPVNKSYQPPAITIQKKVKRRKHTHLALSCNISCLGAENATYVKIRWL